MKEGRKERGQLVEHSRNREVDRNKQLGLLQAIEKARTAEFEKKVSRFRFIQLYCSYHGQPLHSIFSLLPFDRGECVGAHVLSSIARFLHQPNTLDFYQFHDHALSQSPSTSMQQLAVLGGRQSAIRPVEEKNPATLITESEWT